MLCTLLLPAKPLGDKSGYRSMEIAFISICRTLYINDLAF